jgi:hypothetical protein
MTRRVRSLTEPKTKSRTSGGGYLPGLTQGSQTGDVEEGQGFQVEGETTEPGSDQIGDGLAQQERRGDIELADETDHEVAVLMGDVGGEE